MITIYPPEDADQKRGHKLPFMASELFSCECWPLIDLFFAEHELLEKLFLFLYCDWINVTLAGYFSKLLITLINRNPQATLGYIFANSLQNQLLHHVNSKSISEILIKILVIESATENFFLEERKKLIQDLVKQLVSENQVVHLSVGTVLAEFISKCGEANSGKEIFAGLVASDSFKILIDSCRGETVSRICMSLSFFKAVLECSCQIELLRPVKGPSEEDSTIIEEEEISEFVSSLIGIFPVLVRLLEWPSDSLIGSDHVMIFLLGEVKLKIAEFVLACVKSDVSALMKGLVKSALLVHVVDLMFAFKNNSILHCVVEKIISACLSVCSSEPELIKTLLAEGKLIENITSHYSVVGISGHITKISASLLKFGERNEIVREVLGNSNEWKVYNEVKLAKQLEIERKNLGEAFDSRPGEISSEENNFFDEASKNLGQNPSSYLKNSMEVDNYAEIDEETEENKDDPMDLDELNSGNKEPSPEDLSPDKLIGRIEIEEGKEEENCVNIEPQPDEEPFQAKLVMENKGFLEDKAKDMEIIIGGVEKNSWKEEKSEEKKEMVVMGFEYWNFGVV